MFRAWSRGFDDPSLVPHSRLAALRRGGFTSVRELVDVIRRFIDAWNDRCQSFVWTATADQILAKANRQTTSVADH